jgi:outer membrane lipoprotein SlyB
VRRWLLALLLGATAAQAQQSLDLRVRSVTEGVVHSLREVHATSAAGISPAVAAQGQIGLPSELDSGPVVGSVVSRPFGGASSANKWHVGSVGTPEMQSRFAGTGYEVVVTMDDGERRVFRPRDPARFGIGERVTVRSGELEPI